MIERLEILHGVAAASVVGMPWRSFVLSTPSESEVGLRMCLEAAEQQLKPLRQNMAPAQQHRSKRKILLNTSFLLALLPLLFSKPGAVWSNTGH